MARDRRRQPGARPAGKLRSGGGPLRRGAARSTFPAVAGAAAAAGTADPSFKDNRP